ncbi:MAG: hypothetical protein WCT31_03985 [Candidatus Micrarchaeia archaeon]|jgi:hypothetical protein
MPKLIYRENTFVDRFKKERTLGAWVREGVTEREICETIIRQNGGRINWVYDENYGKYYIESIEIAGLAKLTNIQLYDENGRMFFHIGKDGNGSWGNPDSITADVFTRIKVQDDSDRGEKNKQDFSINPLEKIANAEPNYLPEFLRKKGGGGADHADNVTKEQLQSIEMQEKITFTVDASTGISVSLTGEEIVNNMDLVKLMGQKIEELGLPAIPNGANNAFDRYLENALMQALPENIKSILQNGTQAGMLDGMNFQFSIMLKMVATQFDAFERYQLSINGNMTGQSGNASVTQQMEAQTQSEPFYVEFAKAMPQTMGTNTHETIRIENATSAKEYVPEESMIVRLIMNPTERRLWGRLYGFPDEEVAQIPNENSQSEKLIPLSKQTERGIKLPNLNRASETKTEKSDLEMYVKYSKKRRKKERAAEEGKKSEPSTSKPETKIQEIAKEKQTAKKPMVELPKEIPKDKKGSDEKDFEAGKGEKAGKKNGKQNARKEIEPKKEEKRAQRLEELKKKLELAKERKEDMQKKAEKNEKEEAAKAKTRKESMETKSEKAKTNLINLDDKKKELEKKAKDKQKPDTPKLAEKKDYGMKKAVANSAKGNESEAKETKTKAEGAKKIGKEKTEIAKSALTRTENKKSARVPNPTESKKPEENKKTPTAPKAKEPRAKPESTAIQVYSPFQSNRRQKTVSPFALGRIAKPRKRRKTMNAA